MKLFEYHIAFLDNLLSKGGPDPADYALLTAWISELSDHTNCGKLSKPDLTKIVDRFGDAFSPKTMQGFANSKPHGYAGDFEMIDRIYQNYICEDISVQKWDIYWQQHPAAQAVRNRAEVLECTILESIQQHPDGTTAILNLASGPCRDLHAFFKKHQDAPVTVDCIDQDSNAITFAEALCSPWASRTRFINGNALRFKADKQYHLIWSSGLFDYFEDRVFVFMLKRLRSMLAPEGGRLVVGNFAPNNPSRAYMNLFGWELHHRSSVTLKALAAEAGFNQRGISIFSEASGVNLFLRASG